MCDCSLIKPLRYNNKRIVWKNKLFLKDKAIQFMHMPLNMRQVVGRMWTKIKLNKADPPVKDFLMLTYDPSPWVSEVYMNVTKRIPKANIVKLSGTFIAKVFDGPFNSPPKWVKEFDTYLSKKKLKALKYYFYFTMCPECIKKTGHNYCIVFAQIK